MERLLSILLYRDGIVKIWLHGTKTDGADTVPQCGLSLKVSLNHIENYLFKLKFDNDMLAL